MGENGSAKSDFVNIAINYVFNVEWRYPFRFHLNVDEHAGRTTIYKFNYSGGFRTSYSLSIVDTPSIDVIVK